MAGDEPQTSYEKRTHRTSGFIRSGRPIENGYIESFNGRLRDECLKAEVFFTLAAARRKLALCQQDYEHLSTFDAGLSDSGRVCGPLRRWK